MVGMLVPVWLQVLMGMIWDDGGDDVGDFGWDHEDEEGESEPDPEVEAPWKQLCRSL